MQRIPLILTVPTILWNRKIDEINLFEKTLVQPNVKENEDIVKVLEQEVISSITKSYQMAELKLTQALNVLDSNKENSQIMGSRILNVIILRAPKDSKPLQIALKQRGLINMKSGNFKYAVKDFELYLTLKTDDVTEEIFEIYGKLTVCYYFMRKYDKSRNYCKIYKKLRDTFSEEIFKDPCSVTIDSNISAFEKELHLSEECVPQVLNKITAGMPFNGFNRSSEIPLASSVCFYIPENEKSYGVYTKCTIPKEEIVVLENPFIYSIRNPLLQCECCFEISKQMYTCFECRYKTYCSLECIKEDTILHQYECYGYKILIIPVLNADSLFRLFLRVSTLLEEHIFSHDDFGDLKSALDVWKRIELSLAKNKLQRSQLLKYLELKPNYDKMCPEKYATLVCVAFRLTFYIERFTPIFDTYYKRLNISVKQKLNLVGAILIRLHGHLVLNSMEFEFPCKKEEAEVHTKFQNGIKNNVVMLKPRKTVDVDIDIHYGIDKQKDVIDVVKKMFCSINNEISSSNTNPLESTNKHQCTIFNNVLSTYADAIGELVLTAKENKVVPYITTEVKISSTLSKDILCARINHLDSLERIKFVEMFSYKFHLNFTEYFLRYTDRNINEQCLVSLFCPTLKKFQHSCEPNVEVILLDNGVVIAKALRPIRAGEELFLSYKTHFLRHFRADRKSFHISLGLKCKCNFCTIPDKIEPMNKRMALYCNYCTNTITPVQKNCCICNAEYGNLLQKYKNILISIEEKIEESIQAKANERDIYKLYLMKYYTATTSLVPCHELRINAEIEYAQFLALKNYASKSIEIIQTVGDSLLDNYDEHAIFGFKKDILLVIKIIVHFNLDRNLFSLSYEKLKELCKQGMQIIYAMLEYIQFHEKTDDNIVVIMNDLNNFLHWREKILEKVLSHYTSNIT